MKITRDNVCEMYSTDAIIFCSSGFKVLSLRIKKRKMLHWATSHRLEP